MSFNERLIKIYVEVLKIRRVGVPLKKYKLASIVSELFKKHGWFTLTDLTRLNDIVEVEVGLGRMEDRQDEIVITEKGVEWLKKQIGEQEYRNINFKRSLFRCPNCGAKIKSKTYESCGEYFEDCPNCDYKLQDVRGETYTNYDFEKDRIVEQQIKLEGDG